MDPPTSHIDESLSFRSTVMRVPSASLTDNYEKDSYSMNDSVEVSSELNDVGDTVTNKQEKLETLVDETTIAQRALGLPFVPLWSNFLTVFTFFDCLVIYYSYFFSDDLPNKYKRIHLFVELLVAIDLLLLSIYKLTLTYKMIKHRHEASSWIFIGVQATTLLPLRYLFNPANKLTLFKFARLVRLYVYFHDSHQLISTKIMDRFFELCFHVCSLILIYMIIVHTMLSYVMEESMENWKFVLQQQMSMTITKEKNWFVFSLYITMGFVSLNGLEFPFNYSSAEQLTIMIMIMFSYSCLVGFHLAQFSKVVQNRMLSCFLFYKYIYLYDEYLAATTNVSKKTKSRLISNFKLLWKERRGVSTLKSYYILLPGVMIQDLGLEIFWGAFQHTHIFRDMDFDFLRYTALHMEQIYIMPGDFIYTKNYLKRKFVYIVSGVLQLLNDEGDKVPILSFSSGTSLGVSSLILPSTTSKTLICKTSGVLHVLRHAKFMQVTKYFPKQFKQIRKNIFQRYEVAKNHHSSIQRVNIKNPYNYNRNVFTLRWFQYINKRMLAYHLPGHYIFNHKFKEGEYWDRLHFLGNYIDDFALAEDVVLVKDTIFLRQTCPCILQPYPTILKVWHSFINLLIIITVFVIPYNVAFATREQAWYSNFMYAITIFWGIDIYIKLSTAIVLEETIISDMLRILLHRLSQFGFLLDIASCLPVEIMFYYYFSNLNLHTKLAFQMNRLLKVWHLEQMFDDIEDALNINIIFVRTIKCLLYSFVILYGLSVCLFLFNCYLVNCDTEYWQPFSENPQYAYQNIVKFVYFTTNILTGSTIMLGKLFVPIQFFDQIFLMMISRLYFIYMLGQISSSSVLLYYSWVSYMQTVIGLKVSMSKHELQKQIYKRVYTFLYFYYEVNKGLRITTFPIRNKRIEMNIRQEIYLDILQQQPLFSGLSKQFLKQICKHLTRLYVPENEVVIYTGQTSRSIVIILYGYCEMIASSTELKNRLLGAGDNIALLECLLHIPSVHTYVASTALVLLTIPEEELREQVLPYFLDEGEPIKDAIRHVQELLENTYILSPSLPINIYEYHNQKSQSFVSFRFEPGSSDYENFNSHYEKSKMLFFMKNLLMQSTILPEGNFAFYWEISRCCFAVISVMAFSNPLLVTATAWTWIALCLHFLDIMAYIDIYIQMHMCYYDERGILLSHPIKTVSHYMSHRFVIDLIGSFKFDMLTYFMTTRHHFWMAFYLNRLLQINRIYGLINYYKETVFSYFISVYISCSFLFLITTIVFIAGMAISGHCYFGDDIVNLSPEVYAHGIECDDSAWLRPLIKNHTVVTPLKAYIYYVYVITSLITSSVLQVLKVDSDGQAIFNIFVTYLGFFFVICNVSLIVAGVTAIKKYFFRYKDHVSSLIAFMKGGEVSEQICGIVLKHLQLDWNRNRGNSPCELYKVFNDTLRDDLLLATYRNVFRCSSIFDVADDSFIHKILAHAENEMIMNEGYVLRINDVHPLMYILVSGTVKVFGPADTYFATLHPGSIFGNLDNTVDIRQTITIVANGHVDVLKVKSQVFHKTLRYYPEFRAYFEDIISLRFDFIPNLNVGLEEVEVAEEVEDEVSLAEFRMTEGEEEDVEKEEGRVKYLQKQRYHGNRRFSLKNYYFDPNSTFIIVWRHIFVYGVCVLPLCQEFYELKVEEMFVFSTIWSYFADVLFLGHMYIKSHTARENEFGIMITEGIVKGYLKSLEFKFDTFTAIPLEVFALFFAQPTTYYFWLRFNKWFRIAYFIRFNSLNEHKLTISYIRNQVCKFLFGPVLMIHCLTCILAQFSSKNPVINESNDKFRLHLYHIRTMLTLLLSSSVDVDISYSNKVLYLIAIMIWFHIYATLFLADISVNTQSAHLLEFHFREKISGFCNYLKLCDVSAMMQSRALRYVQFTFGKNRSYQYPALLQSLPYYLRETVMIEVYGRHISDSAIFRNCHPDFVRQVVPFIRPTTFYIDDYVTFKGSVNCSLFIIRRGQVEELDGERRTRLLNADEMFGIKCGLNLSGQQKFSYRCMVTTVILTLNYDDWKYLLTYYPASQRTIDQNIQKLL